MSDNDFVRVGCIRCKRTKRSEMVAATAQKTIEDVFEHTFDYIRKEASDLGVEIDDELKAKLLKWGAKQGLFEPEAPSDRVSLSKPKTK